MYYQISSSPLVTLQPVALRVDDVGDGTSTLVRVSDNFVLSCQPDGPRWEWRPPGTSGGYERCVVKEGVATYNPQGPTQPGYVFALQAVPNE